MIDMTKRGIGAIRSLHHTLGAALAGPFAAVTLQGLTVGVASTQQVPGSVAADLIET